MILHHYTANTGHYSAQPRAEISAATLNYLAPFATRPGNHELHGGVKLVIPKSTATGIGSFRLLNKRGDDLIVAMLAWQAGPASFFMWSAARKNAPLLPDRPAGHPWLSVIMLPACAQADKQTMLILGDIERCVAWSIITQQPGG